MTGAANSDLPKHLQRYVVDQDYSRYTPVDQAVWRHIMRQLKSFLSTHAHPCYVEGLKKTGIEVDRIPSIEHMSTRLAEFGWRAVPVSGFIPPAAFMELQSLGVLPIASDMRTLEHLLYTPAPDIVHEAAGHAPILVDPAFAEYLKSYASVARKAIISDEDMDQYEAIRILSDVKEDPGSTAKQIRQAEERLEAINKSISHISEAALLGRMNWWTAEYGLIGSLRDPKIFGAGLLSSVGEARACLEPKVKKIPLSIECIQFSYDITEQQPQLFVVETFDKLESVLQELAAMMAFKTGGLSSVEKVLQSKNVNTIELDSGLQISGILKAVHSQGGAVSYLGFSGPTLLALKDKALPGQGVDHHRQGFGTPIGRVAVEAKQIGRTMSSFQDLGELTETELQRLGVQPGTDLILKYETGAIITGLVKAVHLVEGRLKVLTLSRAKALLKDELLFDPAWGEFDIAVGTCVKSAYGGPADRAAFGETEDFTRKLVPRRIFPDETLAKHKLYEEVRLLLNGAKGSTDSQSRLSELIQKSAAIAADDWLIQVELLEAAEKMKAPTEVVRKIEAALGTISTEKAESARHIEDARRTLHLEN
jgi:phenylalanine-4-hydroxylase